MAIRHRNLQRGSLIPADDYLILHPTFLSNVTESGIHTGAEEQVLPFGQLIARGSKCGKYVEGDYLLLGPMGGYTYELMGVLYIICRECDVVAQVALVDEDPAEETPPPKPKETPADDKK